MSSLLSGHIIILSLVYHIADNCALASRIAVCKIWVSFCFLSRLSQADITCVVDSICISWCVMFLWLMSYFVLPVHDFIIDNNNNISSYRTCIELGGVGRLWWVRTIRRHWETWESTAARWQRSDSAASRLGICRQPTAEPTLHPQQTTPWNDDHVLLPVLHKLHPPLYLSVGYSLA